MSPAATASPSQEFLTSQEAADYLRISLRTLARLEIPKIKARKRVVYRRSTLDAWAKANEAG